MSISLDDKSLKALLKRFDKAPARMQGNAMRSVGRAGANVVKAAAKSKAPAHLSSTIKVVPRKAHGKKLQTKFSVAVGGGTRGVEFVKEVRAAGLETSDNHPAMWVEFGTYGKRDYKGTEPYSPDTLKKKSYKSGRSNSPYWKVEPLWIEPHPFMRPAIDNNVQAVMDAMVVKLDTYLKKKGL